MGGSLRQRPSEQEIAAGRAAFARAATAAAERTLGEKATGVEDFPALPGRMRRSVRVRLGARSVIATRRGKPAEGAREAETLRVLGAAGAPVPALIAFDEGWMIHEDIGPRTLSVTLDSCDAGQGEAWLDRALASLAAIHVAARVSGLAERVAAQGPVATAINAAFHANLVRHPPQLCAGFGLTAPPLLAAERLMRRTAWVFAKWDASPGNAAVRADGSLAWFDWVTFGGRSPLDDVAYLLCNEYVPEWPEAEARLIHRHLGAFDAGAEDGQRYLAVFGTLSLCWRLAWFFHLKGDGPWWDDAECLKGDIPGPSLRGVTRLARRAARWARRAAEIEPLVPALDRIVERLAEGGREVGEYSRRFGASPATNSNGS